MARVIVISGTPGTGKTELMETVCSAIRALCVNAGELAVKEGLVTAYDFLRDTYVVDEEALKKRLIELSEREEVVIIESVDPCVLREMTDLLVVTECSDLRALENRLRSRGWSELKIAENLEAEALGIVEESARTCVESSKIVVVDSCAEGLGRALEAVLKAAQRA